MWYHGDTNKDLPALATMEVPAECTEGGEWVDIVWRSVGGRGKRLWFATEPGRC